MIETEDREFETWRAKERVKRDAALARAEARTKDAERWLEEGSPHTALMILAGAQPNADAPVNVLREYCRWGQLAEVYALLARCAREMEAGRYGRERTPWTLSGSMR